MRLPEPPLAGISFAESQLRRHGWRRGQGLGKREDGIAEAIRVKVKCDTAGVGHDAAEPFSFHWWDHLFNKAAANISVEDGQDGISMKTLAKEGLRISSKKPHKAASAGSMLYGRFVKSATLTASGEEPTRLPSGSDSREEEEEEEKLDLSSARRLTDEELMRACGGRTAHKGARHGLTMSAKLARLEEQERAFLAKYRQEGRQQECPRSSLAAGSQGKGGRERKQCRDGADPEGLQSQEPSGEEEEAREEEKDMKRKKRRKNQEPSGEEEVTGEEGKVMKRKKKKRKEQEPSGEEEVAGEEEKDMKRKKKKRKNQEPSGEEDVAGEEGKVMKKKEQEPSGREEGKVMKRKKQQEGKKELAEAKKKRKKQEEDNEPAETEIHLEDTDGPDQAGHSPRKKKKRKAE